jgi:hypothetical protein
MHGRYLGSMNQSRVHPNTNSTFHTCNAGWNALSIHTQACIEWPIKVALTGILQPSESSSSVPKLISLSFSSSHPPISTQAVLESWQPSQTPFHTQDTPTYDPHPMSRSHPLFSGALGLRNALFFPHSI